MNKIDQILNNTKKIKSNEYVAKCDGLWLAVCSINKFKRTIRLYNQYGVFETDLDAIEDLKTWNEYMTESS